MPTGTEASYAPDRVGQVLAWFESAARDLPWRRQDCSPWGVLVSEIMLQQTPVVRVMPVWLEWMERWPAPGALAASSQADAVRAWGRLGYPRRAKRLWECAVTIESQHGGQVPATQAELLGLPGVGEYTAAAVASFAFHQRAVVLDTNVRRVIARAWLGEPLPSRSITQAERELADAIAPTDAPTAWVWAAASMELGALVCTSRAPDCERCPLASSCAWLAAGRVGLEQARGTGQAWKGTDRQVRGVIIAILRGADAEVVVDGRVELAGFPASQVETCLESLLADGLVAESASRPGAFELAG